MADPAWFFSTLAQSTAAIIGFIIAFSAVLYQLDRQRRERRTQELREELIDFEDEYDEVLVNARFLILDSFPEEDTINEEGPAKFVSGNEGIEMLFDAVRNFERISDLFDGLDHSPNPKRDYLISDEEFEELASAVEALSDTFSLEDSDGIRAELHRLTGIPKSDLWDANVFGYRVDSPKEADPTCYSYNIQEWALGGSGTSRVLTGQTLRSLNTVVRRLERDFHAVEAKKRNTLVGYEPDVKYPLFLSGILLVIGVFLPMLFIMSPPSQLPQLDRTTIYIVQWVLVLGTLISSLNLLRLLANRISGSS